MKLRNAILSFLTCILIASCGKDNPSSPDPPDPPEEEVTSEEIGSDGGEITSPDGNLTLTFPEGALSGTETITIGELSEDDLGSEFDTIIDSLGIGGVYELSPDGLQFDEPVTATITSNQSAALNDSTLELSIRRLMFISSDGQGELLDSLRIEPAGDGSGNVQLSGDLSHFSTITVTEAGASGLLTATISGIPKQLQVGHTTGINVRAEVRLLKVEIPVFEPSIFLPDVFVPEDAQVGDNLAFPMPEVTPDTENENFSLDIVYECDKKGQNSLNGSVEVGIPEDQPGNLSDFFETERSLFVGFLAEGDVPETKCVEKEEPSAILGTGLLSFPAQVTLTKLEAFFLLFHYGDLFLPAKQAIQSSDFTQAQQVNTQFGEISGTFPVAFSGGGKVAVIDLLTNELLMEIDASSLSPLYGVAAVATEPAHESATFVIYGEGGTGDIDTQGGGFFSTGLGAYYDAVPAGGDIFSGTYIKTGGSTMLQTYNSDGYYSFPDGHSHVYGGGFEDERYPVSSWVPDRPDDSWPGTIGVGRNAETLESSVFLIDTQGENDPVKVADVGQDARKVRCTAIENGSNNLVCGVTVFGEDQLALFTWDGETQPAAAGTVDVGDGPVNLDLRLLPNGNIGVLTSGFNDNSITEIELATDGSVISNNTRLAPTGCESPGHTKFIRDAENLKIIGTCYDSANYFVVESKL